MFGWSYPPGCSGTPYDEVGSMALHLPELPTPLVFGAWWTEDDQVGVTRLDQSGQDTFDDVLGTLAWDDELSDEDNIAAAVAIVREALK